LRGLLRALWWEYGPPAVADSFFQALIHIKPVIVKFHALHQKALLGYGGKWDLLLLHLFAAFYEVGPKVCVDV
jgi:hypothetical protein